MKDDRTTYIGGSDAASALQVSPWRSRYMAWAEKVGIEPPPDLDKMQFVYFGTVLEPIVAQEFMKRTGRKVRVKRALVRHKTIPYIAGHIDRTVFGERAFLECKTSNAFDYKRWGASESGMSGVPEHYLAQCDHYMFLLDCTHCYVAVLIGGNDFRWYRIERDAKREEKLVAAEKEFWDFVQTKDPPPVYTEEDARKRWKTAILGTSVAVTMLERTKVVRLAKVQEQIKELSKERDAIRDLLIPMFQDRQYLSESGEPIMRFDVGSQSRFDIDEFRKKHKALAKKFTTTNPVKRLNILI